MVQATYIPGKTYIWLDWIREGIHPGDRWGALGEA